ncbi:MAG: hypothetical protein QOF21_2354, partial [Actinomycetota bacterium]
MRDVLTSIDELLDRAIAAFNEGEVERAHSIAGEVLATDSENLDANQLLATEVQPEGEIRRLAVMFCDLVGSTEMSSRLEPETYRRIVARCQAICRGVIERRYEGSIVSLKGDGILAAFGFPVAHENDAVRAVRAGLDLLAAVRGLTDDVARELGEEVALRVAVHKGVVFLDLDERDLYGFAVNVAARLEGLAVPGTLLISDDIKRLLNERFDLEEHAPREVKGVASPLVTYTVLGERMDFIPRARGALVGRHAELETMRGVWQRTRNSAREPGECIAVVGDAGIGKSRLTSALVDEAEADGGVIVELDGSPLEIGSGLWPVRRLIETRCGFSRDADSTERLHRLRLHLTASDLPPDALPPLATLVGIPPEAGYEQVESDARRLREEIEDAAFGFLVSCFAGSRGLLVCEDAHWYDDQTAALVKRATQKMRSEVLTVITTRTDAVVPRGSLVSVVTLEPLAEHDALELLNTLGIQGLSTASLHDIVERGDGVPLYLEELLRASTQTHFATDAQQLETESAVPEVLYESLLARLNVTPEGAALAAAAAAIGRESDRNLLAIVSELSGADLDQALSSLSDGLILEPVDAAGDRYRFRHELLREVAYDLQPPTRRRVLHGRIGDALVAAATDDDAVEWRRVAVHYAAAVRVDDAVDAYEKASVSARQRGGLGEAKSLLTDAIDIVGGSPDSTPEREVNLRLGRGFLSLSMEGHSSPDAAADYERCLELSLNQASSDGMFATLMSLWSYYAARAEFDRADQVLDVLMSDTGALPPVMKAVITVARGLDDWYRGDFTGALDRYMSEAETLTDVGDDVDLSRWWFIPSDPLVAGASTGGILAHISVGDLAAAAPLVARARAMCAELPFPRGPFTLAGFLSFESWWNVELGDFDNAMRVVEELADLSGRYGFDSWGIVAATQRQVFEGLRIVSEGVAPDQRPALSALATTVGGYMSMWKMIDQWVFTTYYTTAQGMLHAAAGETEL